MFNKVTRRKREEKGFTLLEVLIAMAIATLMIVIVAPLSRHIVRTTSTIRSDLAGLTLFDAVAAQAHAAITFLENGHTGTEIRSRVIKLAPFDYDPSVNTIWQPVLVSTEIRMADGRLLAVERISLQRESQ